MKYILISLLTLLLSVPGIMAQESPDSSAVSEAAQDTLEHHSPKRAAIYSAVLPGLGQIYNRKYWKPPIIWGGMAASIWAADWNRGYYTTYRDAYVFRMDDDTNTVDAFPFYSANDIKTLRDYYHRNLELSYIAAGLVYVLNILDATVDAQLFEFDISDDLGMRLEPAAFPLCGEFVPGLKLSLKF